MGREGRGEVSVCRQEGGLIGRPRGVQAVAERIIGWNSVGLARVDARGSGRFRGFGCCKERPCTFPPVD
jgi:hypothetical protein